MKVFFGKWLHALGLDALLLKMLERLLGALVKKLQCAADKCAAWLDRIRQKLVAV